MESNNKAELDDQIGFRCRTADKAALKKLAQQRGFADIAALLRNVIQDLLQQPNQAPNQEQILSRLGSLEAQVTRLQLQDLKQIKIALFILGTEQRKQGASLTLVNPLQAKRMQGIFPEFINHKEQP